MSEREPVTLEFLACQLDRMLADLASLRDDVNVLTAIVQRLDNSHTRLLTETRATHSRVSRQAKDCAALRAWPPATNNYTSRKVKPEMSMSKITYSNHLCRQC
jgi:hypothetical protein